MLGHNLEHYIKNVREHIVTKDKDHVVIIEGSERIGKSSLAIQICQAFDKNFTLENIAWDSPQLKKLVYGLPKHSAILADEGVSMFFSRESMRAENRDAVRLLSIMGERNNLLAICVTRLNMMDKYITEGRISTLVRITKRGRYKFYSPKKIKTLSYNKTMRKWKYPAANYAESYTLPEDKEFWKAYKKLKVEYNTEAMNPGDEGLLTRKDAAVYAGRKPPTINLWVRNGKLKPVNVKGRNFYPKDQLDKIINAVK